MFCLQTQPLILHDVLNGSGRLYNNGGHVLVPMVELVQCHEIIQSWFYYVGLTLKSWI